MAAGPGRWTAAAGTKHGHLRASHDDREHVISTLKTAFVQGRLTKDELDDRVGQTLVSRTYRDLAALTADLPAEARPAPVRTPGSPARPRVSWVARVSAIAAVGPAVLVALFSTRNDSLFKWLITVMIVYYLALMVAGAVMLDSRLRGASGGQPPPRPARRRRALAGERPGGAGDDLSLCRAHREDAQRGRRSPPLRGASCAANLRATALQPHGQPGRWPPGVGQPIG